ncbi:MAG: VTT domain-containing protein [Coriobacteriia bacterium]|nr:VTT domain-containing protein [Coriobacteriia bacterium]
MDLFHMLIGLLTNTLATLQYLTAAYGVWIYGILFLIIFCETGLVVTPFLPGDSLLFAAGVLASPALGHAQLNVWALWAVVFAAALLGDNANYLIGRFFGHAIIDSGKISGVMKPEYIERTQDFFRKHGGKTISLARFFPIIRTYAPFMAGVGRMKWGRFVSFSALGSAAWITLCIGAGWFLGGIPFVQKHFEVIVIAIILVTLAPSVVHAVRSRTSSHSAEQPAE